MFGEATRSFIPVLRKQAIMSKHSVVQNRRNKRQAAIKKHYDKTAKDLSVLKPGQSVYMQMRDNAKWQAGQIVSKEGNRSYLVKCENGVYRRNRVHLRVRADQKDVKADRTADFDLHITVPDDNAMALPHQPAQDNQVLPQPAEAHIRPRREHRNPLWMRDFVT